MFKKNPNKRETATFISRPELVKKEIIDQCRKNVEHPAKRHIRSLLLPLMKKKLGITILGEGFQWGSSISVQGAVVGRYVYIGPGAEFSGVVVIGDLTMVSADCKVIGNDHVFDNPEIPMRINFPNTPRPITIIGSDVWIGRDVKILEGIRIGRGSIIAAGSIVTKDVPPYSVMCGIPARLLKPRFNKESENIHELLLYN